MGNLPYGNPYKFNIKDIYANFSDMDRSNLFQVEIQDGDENDSGIMSQDFDSARIHFLAKGISLPTITNGIIEVALKNRKFKVAGDPTYEDITMTVMGDNLLHSRRYFEEWSSQVNALIKNGSFNDDIESGNMKEYFKTVRIYKLDRKMQKILTVDLMYAFPSSIDSLELGWENSDTISEFGISIAYSFPRIEYND